MCKCDSSICYFSRRNTTIIISPESVSSRNCWQMPRSSSGATLMRKLFLFITALAVLAVNVHGQSLDAMIDRDIASWLTTYRNLHAAPELSHREEKTSAFVAGELRKLGFTVTERIGKFQNEQWIGYGVVGVMKN